MSLKYILYFAKSSPTQAYATLYLSFACSFQFVFRARGVCTYEFLLCRSSVILMFCTSTRFVVIWILLVFRRRPTSDEARGIYSSICFASSTLSVIRTVIYESKVCQSFIIDINDPIVSRQ